MNAAAAPATVPASAPTPGGSFESLTPVAGMPRFPALDGWRGISILLVIGGHLFPLGPKAWQLNGCIAELGMAIFFTLSGFLITTTLLFRPSVREFLIRRFCRIVPLAWLYMLVMLLIFGASWHVWVAQFLFYANLPPFLLLDATGHLWSLCVEVQFYLAIAMICAVFGRRGLWSIPVLCLLVTAHRVQMHTLVSIVTSLRVDEILAGGTLALICNTPSGVLWVRWARRGLTWVSPLALMPLAIASSHDFFGPFCYLRPYLAASMVGSTLLSNGTPALTRYLGARWLAYVAAISYALYIFHPSLGWGWLNTSSKLLTYVERLPELAVVFGLAHLSTFYFEDYWIRFGKRLSKRPARAV
jgi:peptidoglycan/LPS O-acetylase OafA/YrhL